MKYRLKKKMAMLLAASMITSQASFVFANDETSVNENLKAESRVVIKNEFNTNLDFSQFTTSSECYEFVGSGLNGNSIGKGDRFILSDTIMDTSVTNFEYSVDVTFNENSGAAALVFGADKTKNAGEYTNLDTYAVNLEAGGTFKMLNWGKDYTSRPDDSNISRIPEIDGDKDTYNLKVRCEGKEITYYIDNIEVAKATAGEEINGKLGFLTFDADVTYKNAKWKEITPVKDFKENLITNLKFPDTLPSPYEYTEEGLRGRADGDQFCFSDTSAKNFTYSAHVKFNEGRGAAALAFGATTNYNVNKSRTYATNLEYGGTFKMMNFNGTTINWKEGNIRDFGLEPEQEEYDLKIVCAGNKMTYYVNDVQVGETTTNDGEISGKLGFLTWNGDVTYQNVQCVGDIASEDSYFKTNLDTNKELPEDYEYTDEGLHADASGKGDRFFISNTISGDFVYSADITFNNYSQDKRRDDVAAGIAFRALEADDSMYVANMAPNGQFRLFRMENKEGTTSNIVPQGNIKDFPNLGIVSQKDTYNLKVVCIGKQVSYYIDDVYVAGVADYLSPTYPELYNGYGQKDILLSGGLGFLTFNGDVTYQNVYYTEITDSNTSALKDLQITGGEVEYENTFSDSQYIYQQYVSNDTSSINIVATPINSSDTEVTVKDKEGNIISANNVPLNVGHNFFTVETSSIQKTDDHGDVAIQNVYHLSITRRGTGYYDEDYRGQYHYSVKEGWGNDPCGLVKIGDTYHMMHQSYPTSANWGPMHWEHLTSKDLINWELQPVNFYPNQYGTVFSGCGVYDENNTSGLGKNGKGVYICMITAHGGDDAGSGQRMILAYSQDEGKTWQYYDGEEEKVGMGTKTSDVIVDWTDGKISDDNNHSKAFRDPQIFRYNDKWFMVLAGGIWRIFSSDDLIHWNLESTYTYPDKREFGEHSKDLDAGFQIESECPSIYRLPILDEEGNETGEYKWLANYGGRYYRVGEFTNKTPNGKWQFVPDKEYAASPERDSNLVGTNKMNFGRDSYATMVYYTNPSFNESTQEDVIALNWMNTWDYCNQVDDASNNTRFNGTYNLQLKLALVKDKDGKLVLQQTPIQGYNSLINNTIESSEVIENTTKAIDFKGDSYLVEATFKPEEGTTDVGLNVRTSENGSQKTVINYNLATREVSIDRSKSSIGKPANSGAFDEVLSEVINEKENADGSITLRVYVDRASVEVFSGNYTVAGAMQIFPNPSSKGLEVYSKGGNTTANIVVSPMNSIWKENANTNDLDISKVNSIDYTADGKTTNTQAKVEDWIKDKIKSSTGLNVDSVSIENFKAATSSATGSFEFTVKVSNSSGATATSDKLNGVITKTGSSSSGGSSGGGGSRNSSSSKKAETNTETKDTENNVNTGTPNVVIPTAPSTSSSISKFADVASHWASDSIAFVVERGYFAGTSENSFSPNVPMTRAMVISVLGRVANAQGNVTDKFADVDQSQYYAPFVGWALENGIASGVSETEFSPNTNVTREQLAVMFANFMKAQGYALDATRDASFTDSADISPWAVESVEFMVKAGILNGRTDGSFDPKGVATRAEVATVLKLFLEKTNK